MRAAKPPPPRSARVWAAAGVLATYCVAVPAGLAFGGANWLADPRGAAFGWALILTAAGVLGVQAVAVFCRRWIGACAAAATAGLLLAVPGVLGLPGAALGFVTSLAWADVRLSGLFALSVAWSAATLAASVVMFLWADRLFRWRVRGGLRAA